MFSLLPGTSRQRQHELERSSRRSLSKSRRRTAISNKQVVFGAFNVLTSSAPPRAVTNLAILRRSFLLLFVFCTTPVQAEDEAWTALRDGRVVALMRHARAPGTGDPPGFRLDDCSTQRNLSEEGRAQARHLGIAAANSGVTVTRVLSSRRCRAMETARLAFGKEPELFQPLDSFFGDRARESEQTPALRNEIATWRGPGVLALVTHQVNITVVPAEGEIVVMRPAADGIAVVGTIRP